jgi:pimeloyl-ACP methyl ester carboxylesterase
MRQSFIKIVGEYLDGVAGKITNQTLIINGQDDRETPPYSARRYNRLIENSRLELISGAGHFCFIDKPIKFNTEVKEFLLS